MGYIYQTLEFPKEKEDSRTFVTLPMPLCWASNIALMSCCSIRQVVLSISATLVISGPGPLWHTTTGSRTNHICYLGNKGINRSRC